MFRPKRAPIPLGHSDGRFEGAIERLQKIWRSLDAPLILMLHPSQFRCDTQWWTEQDYRRRASWSAMDSGESQDILVYDQHKGFLQQNQTLGCVSSS